MLLHNRTALVTGGAGRIGHAIAVTLEREGAKVAIADADADRLSRARLTLPPEALIRADVSEAVDVERMVHAAETAIGSLDILVNCHGFVPNCPVSDMDVGEWDRTFAVNVRGTMLTCQAIARRWIERGTRGAIVNMSSGASRSARPGAAHYAGSKAAVNMLTEVLAIELGPHRIRVNAVLPGLILDEVVSEERGDLHPYVNMMLRATPLGRTGSAQDIAEAVAFLASDRSGWTTGALLEITGGSHCGRTHVPLTRELRN